VVNAATCEAVDAISIPPTFKFCAVALTKAPLELREEFSPPQKVFLRTFRAEFRANDGRQPAFPSPRLSPKVNEAISTNCRDKFPAPVKNHRTGVKLLLADFCDHELRHECHSSWHGKNAVRRWC
jgi:hypothetical protein